MPKKRGTEDSSTIQFFQLKWAGLRVVVVVVVVRGGVRVSVEMGVRHHSDNK